MYQYTDTRICLSSSVMTVAVVAVGSGVSVTPGASFSGSCLSCSFSLSGLGDETPAALRECAFSVWLP